MESRPEDRRYSSDILPVRPVDWEVLKTLCEKCNRPKTNKEDTMCFDCYNNSNWNRIL